jgi:hypothetical protein
VIHAKHREAPFRNGAPNDGDAEHGLTVRPGAGKLFSDARVVYEIVLRFISPRGRADRTEMMNPNWFLSTHTDQDGAAIFQQACKMGLEGIVSKRLSAPYRSGPSRVWLKVKNPESPAMIRAQEAEMPRRVQFNS